MKRYLAALLMLSAQLTWARSYHYSSSSDDPRSYLQAIQESRSAVLPELPGNRTIRAGIVTHHFLASGLMVRFFDALRRDSAPDIIVLIGPNHFHHGLADISLSSLPWKTPFGILQTDRQVIEKMRSAAGLPEDPEAFTGEHSVGVLVPFLKYYFPRTRVVPVLVDVNARPARLKKLRTVLAALMKNPRALVLLSMDFSHNSVSSVADARDERAQHAITALDLRGVNDLQVDCRRGLWLLLAALRDLGNTSVQIREHTNSARLTGNSRQADVTSYFSMFFLSPYHAKHLAYGQSATVASRNSPDL